MMILLKNQLQQLSDHTSYWTNKDKNDITIYGNRGKNIIVAIVIIIIAAVIFIMLKYAITCHYFIWLLVKKTVVWLYAAWLTQSINQVVSLSEIIFLFVLVYISSFLIQRNIILLTFRPKLCFLNNLSTRKFNSCMIYKDKENEVYSSFLGYVYLFRTQSFLSWLARFYASFLCFLLFFLIALIHIVFTTKWLMAQNSMLNNNTDKGLLPRPGKSYCFPYISFYI